MFLSRLCGDPIGFTVLGIFVIDKNTILTVRHSSLTSDRLAPVADIYVASNIFSDARDFTPRCGDFMSSAKQ